MAMMVKIKTGQRPSAQFDQIVIPGAVPIRRSHQVSRRRALGIGVSAAAISTGVVQFWDDVFLKRFAEVIPGQIYRAAWQRPWPIGRLVESYGIRSILSLSVMGTTDEKYTSYAQVAKSASVDWVLLPVMGSYMTLAQMAEAADWVQSLPKPLLFHCVAGHHRTTQAQTAWRMRHGKWSAKRAWREVSEYRWTDPTGDLKDLSLIERFGESAYVKKETGYEPTAYDALGGPGHRRRVRDSGGGLLGMAALG